MPNNELISFRLSNLYDVLLYKIDMIMSVEK